MTVNARLNGSNWNIENGYESNVEEDEIYPHRAFGSGWQHRFHVVLGINVDDKSQYCNPFANGFRAALHVPDELPRIPDDYIFIPIDQEIYVSIKPNVITTSNGLRNYSPKKRGCYFKFERRLQFFRTYSQLKCESECEANFTLNSCGCIKFSMPSKSISWLYWDVSFKLNFLLLSQEAKRQMPAKLIKIRAISAPKMNLQGTSSLKSAIVCQTALQLLTVRKFPRLKICIQTAK